MRIEDIETPALIIDEGILKENMKRMEALLSGGTLALRPHYKSHKCADLALRQIRAGAKGMTCAKLSEAEDLADAGVEDILIANQITDPAKCARAARLAGICRLTVCVDSVENIRALSREAVHAHTVIHCYIEYDIGMRRCGVATHEEVLALAKEIENAEGLSFDGIQAYAGHISHEADTESRRAFVEQNGKDLRALLAKLKEAGTPAKELSGGSTGTSREKREEGLYTELQAGSYLFMDATYRALDVPFENSLFILSSVVSVSERRAVVDAGVKSCGMDQGAPAPLGFSVREIGVNEEHFVLWEPSVSLSLGERVRLIPGHCCSTVNLYDKIYLVENGTVTGRLFVTARGKSK